MSATKFNWVYRSGAAANALVPSLYTCVSLNEVTTQVSGDLAYLTVTKQFFKYNGSGWIDISSGSDLEDRITQLEFFVTLLLQFIGF